MVDRERVIRLLAGIDGDRQALSRWAGKALEELDVTALDAIKYRFVTAIEGCARVAHHLAISEAWGVPETNAEAIEELGRRGVVPPGLADGLAEAVRFRNVLVHQYAEVEDQRVVENLDRLDDFADFVREVGGWLPDA
ncbi:MAG: type VII toxin-antitoxin system HepT family RNase toxin [Acidimicrobiia bacterium]